LSNERFKQDLSKAQNAATSPNELKQLAGETKAIRRAVVQNPNTPLDVLYQLAEEFPREFLENPGLPLLLLENPRLFEQIPTRALAKLLQLDDLPTFFLEKATYAVKIAVLRFKKVPLHVLQEFAKDKYSDVRAKVAKHPNASPELLAELAHDTNAHTRQAVAENEKTPKEVLDYLAMDVREEVQSCTAHNINTSPEALWMLLTSHHWSPRRVAVEKVSKEELVMWRSVWDDKDGFYSLSNRERNLTEEQRNKFIKGGLGAVLLVATDLCTPPEVLHSLASYPDRSETKLLATALVNNPNTPMKTFELLAYAERFSVRETAASSKNISPALLSSLSSESDSAVLSAVAANPNTPHEILQKLSAHLDSHVRRSIAENPSVTAALIESLANDESPVVQATAAKHALCAKETLLRLSKHVDLSVLSAIAANPNTPDAAFEDLCNNPMRDSLMYHLMNNPSFPIRLIEALKDDKKFRQYATWSRREEVQEVVVVAKSWKARESLARGYNTTAEVLAELAKDKTALVRAAVAFNQNTKQETIEELCADRDTKVKARALAKSLAWRESIREEELTFIQQSPEEGPRAILAEYPRLPAKFHSLLSRDPEHHVRVKIAKRQDISPSLLKELATDKEVYVRIAVAENPNINEETIQLLATQEQWIVVRLLGNQKTPLEVIEALSRSRDAGIRHSVASSANTPRALLEVLTKDPAEYVRAKATLTLQERAQGDVC
jgi:uncharacterized membrane-anchored protein YhcB (DUF1043 family)